MIKKTDKIYLAGHRGMVGSACFCILNGLGYKNIIGLNSNELDLRNQSAVEAFVQREKPAAIIIAAARVGGILANDTYPYEFLMDNMLIQNNIIRAAHNNHVGKLIFLGSSCIYPKYANQPIKEEYLLTGSLEQTNEWYAIAKISGVKLIESLKKEYNRDYVALMPTNLYGPNDNFDLTSSHVLPAMIRKFHSAIRTGSDSVVLWGNGSALREFLYVDDLANAIVFALENQFKDHIYNVGSGQELSIKALADLLRRISGFKGQIVWDETKPNGTPRKLLDSGKFNELGWRANVGLEDGVFRTYRWYLNSLMINDR